MISGYSADHFVIQFPRGRRLHDKALEIADIFPGFSDDPRAIVISSALPGDDRTWLKRLHRIKGSDPLVALPLIWRF